MGDRKGRGRDEGEGEGKERRGRMLTERRDATCSAGERICTRSVTILKAEKSPILHTTDYPPRSPYGANCKGINTSVGLPSQKALLNGSDQNALINSFLANVDTYLTLSNYGEALS